MTALWWANKNARIVAFDPSAAMLTEAARLLDDAGLSDVVSFECTDIRKFRSRQQFDLIIVHDVLCYSDNRAQDLNLIMSHCRPRGLVSLSDYFGDIKAASVRQIVEAWDIQAPLHFEDYQRLLKNLDDDILLLDETTRRYRDHWTAIRKRIEGQRPLMIEHVGSSAVEKLDRQITSIEKALTDGHFGHLWSILEKK